MEKFKKLVVLEPVRFDEEAEQKLYDYAEDVVIYRDIPETDEELSLIHISEPTRP